MSNYFIKTDITNRVDGSVSIFRVRKDELNTWYHKVSSTAHKEINGKQILLVSEDFNGMLICYDKDTRQVQNTLFVKAFGTKKVMTRLLSEIRDVSVDYIFLKEGRKPIDGKYDSVPAKIVLEDPAKTNTSKKKKDNKITVMTTELEASLNMQFFKIDVELFRLEGFTFYDMLNSPKNLVQSKLEKYMYSDKCVMFMSDCNTALIYTEDYDLIKITNVDYKSLMPHATFINDADLDKWFEDTDFDGYEITNIYLAATKDKSKAEGFSSLKEKDPAVYQEIDKIDFLVNLNKEAKNGNLHKVVGRRNELVQLYKNLLRIKKPSNIVIGKAGIGKSALYELFAQEIVAKRVPKQLEDIILVDMNIGASLAGTKYRGEYEAKIKKVIDLIEKHPNIVLVIDEIHQIVGAGESSESTVDLSNMLKPYLARGKVRIVGCTTKEEYEQYIKPQEALARRFNVIEMFEPNKAETLEMMKSYLPKIEEKFNIDLTDRLEEIYEQCKHSKGAMPDVALEAMETVAIDEFLEKKEVKKNVSYSN